MTSSDASHLIEILILIAALVTLIATVAIGVFAFRGWRETREIMKRVEVFERRAEELSKTMNTYSVVIDLVLEKTSLIRRMLAKFRMQQFLVVADPRIATQEIEGGCAPHDSYVGIEDRLKEIEWLLAKNDHEHRLFARRGADVDLAIEALVQSYGDGRTIDIFDRIARSLAPEDALPFRRAKSSLVERLSKYGGFPRRNAW